MGTILRWEHPDQDELAPELELEPEWDSSDTTIEFRSIIAREGSALADLLRDKGWVVRGGWRSTSEAGASIWNLRFEFETPDGVELSTADHSA